MSLVASDRVRPAYNESPPIQLRAVIEFRSPDHPLPLARSAPCGALFELLESVLSERRPHIPEPNRNRHAALLRELARTSLPPSSPGRGPTHAGDVPIGNLEWVVHSWMESYLCAAGPSLMVSYALNTAEFIEAHAYGNTLHSSRGHVVAELRGLVEAKSELLDRFLFMRKASFKRRVSEALERQMVFGEVPVGFSVVTDRSRSLLLGAQEPFVFVVERCHLNQTLAFSDAQVQDHGTEDELSCDRHFQFRGSIIGRMCPSRGPVPLRPEELEGQWAQPSLTSVRWRAEIPGNWMTHAVFPRAEDDGDDDRGAMTTT